MKILLVVPYLYPALSYGGPAKVVYDLAKELAARRHKITIYTTDAWNDKRRILEKEKLKDIKNIDIKYFPNIFNNLAFHSRLFTSFGMIWSYYRERNNFDIVHLNDVFVLPNLLIGALAVFFKKPYVYSPHGVLDPVRLGKKYLLKKIMYKLLAKKILSNAKVLIATSDEEKKILNNLGFKNVETVFNGIATFQSQPSRRFSDLEDKEKFTLLYVGKIHPLKGLKETLMALKNIQFPYQLLIAGPDDGDLSNLKKIISKYDLKNIFFLGFVDDKGKAELFKISNLFIHPSKSEGFSISILEAMNYGLPVLITKACNFPDVDKYEAGIVLEGKKELENELEIEFKKIFGKKYLLNDMGKNARKLIMARYSISCMANNIERIYAHV